jgi:hypothetical protein
MRSVSFECAIETLGLRTSSAEVDFGGVMDDTDFSA